MKIVRSGSEHPMSPEYPDRNVSSSPALQPRKSGQDEAFLRIKREIQNTSCEPLYPDIPDPDEDEEPLPPQKDRAEEHSGTYEDYGENTRRKGCLPAFLIFVLSLALLCAGSEMLLG